MKAYYCRQCGRGYDDKDKMRSHCYGHAAAKLKRLRRMLETLLHYPQVQSDGKLHDAIDHLIDHSIF